MLDVFNTVGRAIADPRRVRILKMLEPGELCVCQVTAILGLATATVSKHLSLLKMAGLLEQRKEGRWVYYRIAPQWQNPYASPILELMRDNLDDDPVIDEDRRRLARIRAIPLRELCGMGRHIFNEFADRPDAAPGRRRRTVEGPNGRAV